jgi:hypothetical protein
VVLLGCRFVLCGKDGDVMRYEVRRPISSDRLLDREAMTVSRHRKLECAIKALERQIKGSNAQGGYCEDFVWDCEFNWRLFV